jgi:release factor glutamine methyltransferase
LPYIPSERILKLQTEVKDWEPRVALDGGEDGFDLYRQLLSQLMSKWQSPGLFLAEIDYTQRELAVREFKQYFPNLRAKVTVDPIMKQTFLVAEFQLLTEELRA